MTFALNLVALIVVVIVLSCFAGDAMVGLVAWAMQRKRGER